MSLNTFVQCKVHGAGEGRGEDEIVHRKARLELLPTENSLETMHKDRYPSTFSCQVEAILFIILQIFFAGSAVLKIGEYYQMFPSFSWEIFGHVTRLYHSHASENI